MAMAISVPLYTVDDLERFPDDGNRYELLDGVLLVTPQAAAPHQIVASRIQIELAISLQKPGLAHVVGPGAVVRMPRTQLQPDILVYPARFRPQDGSAMQSECGEQPVGSLGGARKRARENLRVRHQKTLFSADGSACEIGECDEVGGVESSAGG